jgi:hypothetical protein
MPTKPKKPRKEPAERVLIIDEWDEWAKAKVPNGEKAPTSRGSSSTITSVGRSRGCLNSNTWATAGCK